jgi:hypothetical protein
MLHNIKVIIKTSSVDACISFQYQEVIPRLISKHLRNNGLKPLMMIQGEIVQF